MRSTQFCSQMMRKIIIVQYRHENKQESSYIYSLYARKKKSRITALLHILLCSGE